MAKKAAPQKLSDKQARFVLEYMKDLNGKQAAIRSGYAPKSAEVQASKMLSKGKVASAVKKAMKERTEETKIDAAYVLTRLRDIDKMKVSDILNDDLTLKPLKDWPECWLQSISAVDLSTTITSSGQGDAKEVVENIMKKIKWPDTHKNLELMGKHVDVQAFKDRVDHIHTVTLEDLVCGPKDGKDE